MLSWYQQKGNIVPRIIWGILHCYNFIYVFFKDRFRNIMYKTMEVNIVFHILIIIKTTTFNKISRMNEKVIFCQFYCFAILHGLKNTYMRVFYMKWPWNWKIIRALITFSRQGIIEVWTKRNEKILDIIQLTAYRNGMRATCGVKSIYIFVMIAC